MISLLQDDQSLPFDVNDMRVLLQDDNQTILIYNIKLEDEGTYVCNASNRFGSVFLKFNLTVIGTILRQKKQ